MKSWLLRYLAGVLVLAAVYFGACTIAWLLILARAIDAASAQRPFSWRELVDVFFIHPSRRITVCVIASFTVVSALLMTGSRAGSIFSLLAISGVAAIANAVANALQSLGAEPRQLPLSPTYIWELVQAGRKQAAE